MTFRTERVSLFGGIPTRSRLNDQQDRLFQELQQQRPFQAFLGQLKLQKDPIFTRYESNTPKVILFLKKPATINGIRFRADEHTLDEKELQTLFGNSRTYQIIEQLCLNSSEPSMRESKNRPFSPSSVETELEDTAIPPYKFSAKLLRDSEEREQKLLAALDQSERRFLAALSESEQRYSELCKQLIALVASTMIPQQPLGQNHSIQPMSSYENQLEQIAKTFPHLKLPPVDATNPSQIIPTAPMAETIVPVMPKRPVVELAPQDPDEPSALSQDDKDTELESDDVVPFSSSHSPEQRSIVIPSASQPETVSVDVHSEHSSVSPTPSTDEEEFIESSRNLDDQAPVDTIAFSWKNSFFTAPPSREEILQNLQREWTDLQASPATNLTERRSFLTRLLPAQELD
ncbi:MAG TPA: hypothetical protein VHL30_01280, partial [Chlamydiales bacterium]|nr:hypothetical protein [Chlamydiales bacterium]